MNSSSSFSSASSSFVRHPWHGVETGADAPRVVNCYIEMVPTDVVKYELDKESGHLKVDRPQLYSSQCPALYGFVPRTFCDQQVGALCGRQLQREGIVGDGDPLDICVFSERQIQHGGVLLKAVPIGGLRIIDRTEADDKIIAVLSGDAIYGGWNDISDCPAKLIDRLVHYFLSYKEIPGTQPRKVELAGIYNREQAHEVIECSRKDYNKKFS